MPGATTRVRLVSTSFLQGCLVGPQRSVGCLGDLLEFDQQNVKGNRLVAMNSFRVLRLALRPVGQAGDAIELDPRRDRGCAAAVALRYTG
jgi:hypothetical protein